jgi:hypothetical protein
VFSKEGAHGSSGSDLPSSTPAHAETGQGCKSEYSERDQADAINAASIQPPREVIDMIRPLVRSISATIGADRA